MASANQTFVINPRIGPAKTPAPDRVLQAIHHEQVLASRPDVARYKPPTGAASCWAASVSSQTGRGCSSHSLSEPRTPRHRPQKIHM